MRVSAVSFGTSVQSRFNLNTFSRKSEVLDAVSNIPHTRGDTNTASALAYVTDSVFTPENGARQNVPHVAIVITDGRSTEPELTAKEASRARAAGTTIFAIGIGQQADMTELQTLASQPASQFVFTVNGYDALQSIKDLLAIKTCQGNSSFYEKNTPKFINLKTESSCTVGLIRITVKVLAQWV